MTIALVTLACVSLAGQPLTCEHTDPQPMASLRACYDAGISYAERTLFRWPNAYVHFDCLRA